MSLNTQPQAGGLAPLGPSQTSFRLARLPVQLLNESVRTVDRLLTTRPSVTHMDKLWTQIDVLDDVKKMSDEVKQLGSFFNDKFDAELEALKRNQTQLLEVMARQHYDTEDDRGRNLNEFFDGDATRNLDYSEMNEYVADIRQGLEGVGELMKRFDEVRKELW